MDGSPASFDLLFVGSLKTNGGWMFDVVVTFQVGEVVCIASQWTDRLLDV